MASKQVIDRQKAADAVCAVAGTYEARLRTGIASVLGPVATAKEVSDAAALLARAATDLLAKSESALVAADEAHAVELADDDGLRANRDALTGQLRDQLVGLRDALVGMYGAKVPEAVGFDGKTPLDPVMLVRFARQIAVALKKPGALPTPKFKTAVLDPVTESASLTDLANRLADAIDAVAEDVRENQVTKTARDAAQASHDPVFSRSANFLSALFALANEPELADRVRPSTRQPGRLASGTDEAAAAPVAVDSASSAAAPASDPS